MQEMATQKTEERKYRGMDRMLIGVIVLFITFVIKLPDAFGHHVLPWESASFYYRLQKLGTTIITASLSIERNGRQDLVKVAIDSTNVTFPFLRIHNRFSSCVNEDGLVPQQYIKEIDQWGIFSQKKRYTDIFTFDNRNSKVIVERVDPLEVREVTIPDSTYDPLSIFLKYLLEAKVTAGHTIAMKIYNGFDVTEITFHATSQEIHTLLYGEVKTVCLVSEVPFIDFGDKKGALKIWYTDDEKRFPVNISLQFPTMEAVEFELERVEVR
jgi:hypothetical protein